MTNAIGRRATRGVLLGLALALGFLAPSADAQQAAAEVPFAVGERLEYEVRFGSLRVGRASMEVVGVEAVRGQQAWHTLFTVRGGTLFYKVHDRYESWFALGSLASLRYRQDIDEGSYERERTFEIFPDRAVFKANGGEEQPSVSQPLDDGSFLYFVRTLPLKVGSSYAFDRYFRPDRNPVVITVVRKERVKVPAGTFDAVVVQPRIKTKGIFSEGGQAEVWIADDSTRAILQVKSKLKFGSLNLYLRSYKPGGEATATSGGR